MTSYAHIECTELYTIRGGEHILGFALPGQLFIHLKDVSTPELAHEALEDLDRHWERTCWLLTHEDDPDHTAIAQQSKFFRLYPGVWYRTGTASF